jgi:hypothetical protein
VRERERERECVCVCVSVCVCTCASERVPTSTRVMFSPLISKVSRRSPRSRANTVTPTGSTSMCTIFMSPISGAPALLSWRSILTCRVAPRGCHVSRRATRSAGRVSVLLQSRSSAAESHTSSGRSGKLPTTASKETYYSVKRDLLQRQKRPRVLVGSWVVLERARVYWLPAPLTVIRVLCRFRLRAAKLSKCQKRPNIEEKRPNGAAKET